MAVLSIYAAGVPSTGIELLNNVAEQVFYDGDCSIVELSREDLRHKVRQSIKDKSIALVVLDESASEECRDIENGLYSSDRYFKYTDDSSLVTYLNEKYDLNLEIQEEESLSISDDSSEVASDDRVAEIIEKYDSQLRDKDSIIKTLNLTIKELKSVIDEGGYSVCDSSELEALKSENLELKSNISDLESNLKALEVKSKGIASANEFSVKQLTELSTENDSLKKDYDYIVKQLSDERVSSSQKSGLLREKDSLISDLNFKISELSEKSRVVDELTCEVESLNKANSDLSVRIQSRDIDLANAEKEIQRLKESSKGREEELLKKYKLQISDLESSKADVEKEKISLSEKLSLCNEKNNTLLEELDKSSNRYTELMAKLSETEGYLAKANSDNIRLSERNSLLENQTDPNYDSAITELSELRLKYIDLESNIFTSIAKKAFPQGNVQISLFKTVMNKLDNVSFVFSGSTESRKGTYRNIYNRVKEDVNSRYLIVDVTSETAIDYVFGMRKFTDGMEWFTKGGGVKKYLSPTNLSNVSVLSPKLGYVNDSFYLTINWETRLNELENSGYKVILYAGDLSSLISRVLFENFSEIGNTYIYVHGNILGSRSMITNSKGLVNIDSAEIIYFDFDKKAESFYNIMNSKYKCSISSYVRM